MITVQEAADLGCTTSGSSCPKWVNADYSYWTMNIFTNGNNIWFLYNYGTGVALSTTASFTQSYSVRAVVVVSK